jgi:soluble lytic murein transglycosylase-like protein
MDHRLTGTKRGTAAKMATFSSQCRIRVLSTIVPTALLIFLLASPRQLIGESELEDSAAQQNQTAKLESWLVSQDPSLDDASLADLARGILNESKKNALDPVLVLAVIQVESRFDHKAVSPRGAQGLMQVQPAVVKAMIHEGKIEPSQRHQSLKDPLVNIQVGTSYLAFLHEMFGDLKIALTAYNWGPTRIRQKIRERQRIPLGYATKVLIVQRTLKQQLALNPPVHMRNDGANVAAAG